MPKTKDQLPALTFFVDFPEKQLKIPGVASALQSIESTFRIAGLERWPTMILLLWQSCELLLRANLGIRTDENIEAIEMQKRFKDQTGISDSLHSQSMELRILRNRITHSGHSPKDDQESIKMYFGAGLAYTNFLIKTLIGEDMFQVGKKQGLNLWFWHLLSDVRKVVHNKIRKNKDVKDALLPLVIATKRINRFGGLVNDVWFTQDAYTSILTESFQDTEYEIRKVMGESMDKHLEKIGSNGEIIFLPEFSCIGECSSDEMNVMAACEWEDRGDGDYKLTRINAIGCIVCRHMIIDTDVLDVLVFDRLSEKQKELIGYSEYPPAHDNYYQDYVEEDSPRVKALLKEIRDERRAERWTGQLDFV